ncbi:uncharacterized protein [Ptychodera flava]|uniref:uncharacterized protein isoform X2 n=1 Tax=Ptychodera flava TaxID=63121 RepID=UPI00396A779D
MSANLKQFCLLLEVALCFQIICFVDAKCYRKDETTFDVGGVSCDLCKPGTYMVAPCTRNDPTRCEDVPAGYYMRYYNKCERDIILKYWNCRRRCDGPNQVIIKPCTAKHELECGCLDGTYPLASAGQCIEFRCPPGQMVITGGWYGLDCRVCPGNTYSDGYNHYTWCKKRTDCEVLGKIFLWRGNSTHDAICGWAPKLETFPIPTELSTAKVKQITQSSEEVQVQPMQALKCYKRDKTEFYHNGVVCELCKPGTYMVKPCTEDSKTSCSDVPSGHYIQFFNKCDLETIKRLWVCKNNCDGRNQKVVEKCTSTTALKCGCEAGTYPTASGGQCIAFLCQPGYMVQQAGNTDRASYTDDQVGGDDVQDVMKQAPTESVSVTKSREVLLPSTVGRIINTLKDTQEAKKEEDNNSDTGKKSDDGTERADKSETSGFQNHGLDSQRTSSSIKAVEDDGGGEDKQTIVISQGSPVLLIVGVLMVFGTCIIGILLGTMLRKSRREQPENVQTAVQSNRFQMQRLLGDCRAVSQDVDTSDEPIFSGSITLKADVHLSTVLQEIARRVDRNIWRVFVRNQPCPGVSDTKMDDIIYEHQRNQTECIYQCLLDWEKRIDNENKTPAIQELLLTLSSFQEGLAQHIINNFFDQNDKKTD